MVYTDFTKYSHAQLRTMAQALDPGAVMAAGDPWRKAADTLKQIRQTLTKASTEAATSWEGTTSDAFHTRMLTLAASINNAAAYANDAANTLHNTSEAMAKAKRDMPEEPGNWDKVKDTVGDALFGDDDEHIPLADRKKAEAAAIMQTLAMHYRVATPALKPPPALDAKKPPTDPVRSQDRDATNPEDPSGSAAAAGAVMAGMMATADRAAPAAKGGSGTTTGRSSGRSVAPRSSMVSATAPTDSGIKGGTAQAAPRPLPSAVPVGSTATDKPGVGAGIGTGPGTGIDGTSVPKAPNTSVATPSNTGIPAAPSGVPGSPNGTPAPVVGMPGRADSDTVRGSGPRGMASREGEMAGPAPRSGRAFGSSEAVGGRFDQGGRVVPDLRSGGGASGKTGGAVGSGGGAVGREGGRQAFTEGGSGLGARNRGRTEPPSGPTAGMGPVMGAGDARRGGNGKRKDGKRPDYLIEDAETWESEKKANPNVVE
ncbi:WXG100 family type VII secretion target [Kitasatospora sp. NPDC058046]|uniref:WXG100 family type VII secretion target n=1 Tax=Kitasatospora sp. NPDC058046 TaxID=3346312 RepID=UPI0036DCB7E8